MIRGQHRRGDREERDVSHRGERQQRDHGQRDERGRPPRPAAERHRGRASARPRSASTGSKVVEPTPLPLENFGPGDRGGAQEEG